MDLAKRLVVHAAGDLREPVVERRHDGEDLATHDGVMEVRHYEVGVMQAHIGGKVGQEDSGKAADGEVKDHSQRE